MYIYSFSNYTDTPIDKLSNKKAMLSKRFNRADNFINLSLLGAQRCMQDITIDKDSSIYIASRNGNMNSTIKVLDAIFLQDRLPMPFNFLNSVNASTLFFIAQNFNIEGKSLSVDSFEFALLSAFEDIKDGKTALVGAVEEVISDLNLHKQGFNTEHIQEYSRWLLISSNISSLKPIAKIVNIKLTRDSQPKSPLSNLFDFLDTEDNKTFNFIGKNLQFSIEKYI